MEKNKEVKSLKVVLKQDVKGIGKKLQIVEVSEGYARNYLLPKKIAVLADNKNISEANTKSESLNFKKKTNYENSLKMKEKIESDSITFKRKVGEGSKLFGSVTEKEIADEINKKYLLNIEKKKVILNNPIKSIGTFEVKIKLEEGVVAKAKIIVEGMQV
jgi:large subunit ribosomal protein L9